MDRTRSHTSSLEMEHEKREAAQVAAEAHNAAPVKVVVGIVRPSTPCCLPSARGLVD